MVDRNNIIAARDAALACIDTLLRASAELEHCWRAKRDTTGRSCDFAAIIESSGCGLVSKSGELDAFMDTATALVEDMRGLAVTAMDEPVLTLFLARSGQV